MQLLLDNWTNCPMFKLGFDDENLFPTYGECTSTNIYDYSRTNSQDPAVRYEELKPLTTNQLIVVSATTSLPVQDATSTEPDPDDGHDPCWKIGFGLHTLRTARSHQPTLMMW